MEELKCEVIQDLLPSYVEGITSQESNRLIEQHLLSCEKCKDTVIMMKEDECPDEPKIKREIDFMKKIKRKHKVTILICVITLVCVLGGTTAYFTLGFNEETIDNRIKYEVHVTGQKMTVKAKIPSNLYFYDCEKISQSGGSVNFIFSCKQRIIPSGSEQEVEKEITLDGNIKKIYFNGDLQWEK